MGRSFPIAQDHSTHPIILWSFFLSCIAATIAVFLPLCAIFSRKKPSPAAVANAEIKENPEDVAQPVDDGKPAADTMSPPPVVLAASEDLNDSEQADEEDYSIRPLPPPLPSMHEPSSPRHRSKSVSSRGRLTSSMSKLKIISTLSNASKGKGLSSSMSLGVGENRGVPSRQSSRREDKNKKLKHEDSIWKKTIILGEKCKVPEDGDDTIVYDEKGNRISTYHPRTNSSSRQSSSSIQDVVPR